METELESLVVKLAGDASEFLKALKEAEKGTKEAAKDIGKDVDGIGKSFEDLGGQVAGVLALLGAGFGLWSAFEAFSEAEAEEIKLIATTQALGGAVEELMEQYKEYGAQIQATTVVDDDHTLSLLRMASTYDLVGDAAIRAVEKAMQFAGAVDGTATSAASYIRLAAALEKGDIEQAKRFARMVPQLRGIKDETEFLTRANELLAIGQMVVNAEAGTAHGRLQQLKNDYGNLIETVGGFIAEGLIPIIGLLKEVVKWISELSPTTLRWIMTLLTLTTVIKTTQIAVLALGAAMKTTLLSSTIMGLPAWGAGLAATAGALVGLGVAAAIWGSAITKAGDETAAAIKKMDAATEDLSKKWETHLSGAATRGADSLKKEITALEAVIKRIRDRASEQQKDTHGDWRWSLAQLFTPSLAKNYDDLIAADRKRADELAKVVKKYKEELKSLAAAGLSKELAEALDESTSKLWMQYKAVGKTAEEIEKYRLTLLGIPENKFGQLDLLTGLLEGAKLHEQFKTKSEKTAEEIDRISKLFEKGYISVTDYDRAMQSLVNTTQNLASANAVLSGSSTSIEMSMRWKQMMDDINRRPGPSVAPAAQNNRDLLIKIEESTRKTAQKKLKQAAPLELEGQ